MKKILIVVLDGVADEPDDVLFGETPLSFVHTPRLDGLASRGVNGLVYPVGKNIAPESDIAVISLLSYDFEAYYTGRGPIEGYAAGFKIKPGELVFRVNFATADQEYPKILDHRVGRDLDEAEAKALAEELNARVKLESIPGASFELKSTKGHRGVLVIRLADRPLSAWISNTDPAYKRIRLGGEAVDVPKGEDVVNECRPMDPPEEAYAKIAAGKLYLDDRDAMAAAATLANEFSVSSHGMLKGSPINRKRTQQGRLAADLILMRDAGDRLPEFTSLSEKFQVQFGCFAEMPVEEGIAKLTGMEVIDMPQSTEGGHEQGYARWADAVPKYLAEYQGLYVHIKGPDLPGHDRDRLGKAACVKALDKYFFDRLLPQIDFATTVLAVTADHATPCKRGRHSAAPVPTMIVTDGLRPDAVQLFSEAAAQKGSLGKLLGADKTKNGITGPTLLPKLVEIARSV